MRTAMQDIQNMLEILWANTDVVTIESVLDYIRDKGIPSEKEQIIDAYDTAIERPIDNYAEDYYNQTYNQNK